MNYDLKKPCSNCPFRTDIKFYLDPERVEEICDAIVHQQATFACHKTTIACKEDESDEMLVGPKTQHCAGAMIMLEHMEKPNQMMRIMERVGGYDRTKLKMNSPVFKNAEDMVETYQQREGE